MFNQILKVFKVVKDIFPRFAMRRLFTIVLAAATLAGGFAKNPPPTVVAEPELPDSLRATYLYTDGVKRLVIDRDSVGAQRFARG